MGSYNSGEHIAKDPLHTAITCKTEEPHKISALERPGVDFCGDGGGLHMFCSTQTSPSASTQPDNYLTFK